MAHDRPGRQDRPCYLLPCYSTLLLHSATAPRYPPSGVHALAVLGSISLPRTPPSHRPWAYNESTRDGTRTRNLFLRREAPYPLGHTS